MHLLIMGAPGSGKGTQSKVLVDRLNIPAISTGDMLRDAISKGSEIGKRASEYINDGQLVPDDVMIDIVLERLDMADCKSGYILDGFPRTLAQAQAMERAGIKTDAVIFLEVSDDVILKRLGGRRVCSKCSATYHVVTMPSKKGDMCEACGAPLVVREDDKPETIAERLKVYKRQTAPVVEYYRQKGMLLTVDASAEIEQSTEYILKLLAGAVFSD